MKLFRTRRLVQRQMLIPALMACALGLAGPAALAQTNTKAARFYEDALVRFEKNDMPGTIIQLKNALQIDNDQLSVHLLLGRAMMKDGQVAAAEVALREALRLGVNRAEVVLLLGQSYMAQGKHIQILERDTFKPAGLPSDVKLQLLLLLAAVHADLGDSISAMRAINEARAIDARNPDVWLAEVRMRIRARQFKEAFVAADKALALTPDSVQAQYQRGSLMHVRGDLGRALAAYDKALLANKNHVEARIARIGIYLDVGRNAEARADVAELQRIEPKDPRGAYFNAVLAERAGDLATSRSALKEVTDLLDPVPIDYLRYRPQLLMLNGLAHFGLDQSEKARKYLEVFQRVQPDSPVAKLLARIYLAEGNAVSAVNLLESYLRVQPGDGQALTMLAASNMAMGRNAKATSLMQDALKAKDNPAFRTALGLSMIGNGQIDNGVAELEAVYSKQPGQPQAPTALVQLYLQSGQGPKAIPVAEHLVKLDPRNAMFHNLLGMAQAQAGNAKAARAAFEKALQVDGSLVLAKLNLARVEIAARDYATASNRLNQMLLANPKNAEAYNELAVIAERKGQLPDAQRWLEKARDAGGPQDRRWDFELMEFHLRYGRPTLALDAARSAIGKAPDDPRALMAYARAQLANGDASSARNTLNNAARFAGYNAPGLVDIAQLQLAANNTAGAAYSLDKALSGDAGFLPAQALMAVVELRQGEAAKAEKRAQDLVARHPKLAVGHILTGDIALAQGKLAPAIDAYRRAYQIAPNTGSLLKLFAGLSTQDAGKPALRLAEQWLKTNPQDLPVLKALADGHARAGDFPAARTVYETAIRIKPDDAELLNNLANVQLLLKDPAAVKTAELALANAPGSAIVIDTLGWAHFMNGQNEKALQLLREARLRQPANPEIRYHLAAVLAKMGKKSEAREELDAALGAGRPFGSMDEAKKLKASL